MKVLIVEDSRLVVERLKDIVREVPGYEIAGTARDVGGSSRLVPELKPDVIVLDLNIPGGGGLEVLRSVKGSEPRTVVIVLTNYVSIPVRDACFQAGADFFLDKSNEFARLPGVLAQIGRDSGLGPCQGMDSEPIRRKATA